MSTRRSTVGFGTRSADYESEDRGSGCDLRARTTVDPLQVAPGSGQYPWALVSLGLEFLGVLHCLGLLATLLAAEPLAAEDSASSSFWGQACCSLRLQKYRGLHRSSNGCHQEQEYWWGWNSLTSVSVSWYSYSHSESSLPSSPARELVGGLSPIIVRELRKKSVAFLSGRWKSYGMWIKGISSRKAATTIQHNEPSYISSFHLAK